MTFFTLRGTSINMRVVEGAKFWMGVLTELKNRGVRDILIACMDGLSGFPDAVRVQGTVCHSRTSPRTACVTRLIKSGDTSTL